MRAMDIVQPNEIGWTTLALTDGGDEVRKSVLHWVEVKEA